MIIFYYKISKFNLPSNVVIHQTCRKLWIDDSPGEFFNWHSLSADLQSLNLKILYQVNYKNSIRNNSSQSSEFDMKI